jgi:hypothetical protein
MKYGDSTAARKKNSRFDAEAVEFAEAVIA